MQRRVDAEYRLRRHAGDLVSLPGAFVPAVEQPITTDLRMADGVFAKTMVIQSAGVFVPQHAHRFAHISVLVRGSVRVWKDGVLWGDAVAPLGITIDARVMHTFQALVDDTIILCVHDIRDGEGVEIAAEHHLVSPGAAA